MNTLKIVFLSVLAVTVTGCKKHTAWIATAVDPTFVLSKSEPVYVSTPEDSSVRERQLAVTLKNELCRNGFTLTPTIDEAKYVLGLGFEKQSYQAGFTTQATFAGTRSRFDIVNNSSASVYLFNASDYIKNKRFILWEGNVSARKRVFQVYEPIIFKNVLDHYGANFDRNTKLDKSYLRKVADNTTNNCITVTPTS